jgi:hypothetical protein
MIGCNVTNYITWDGVTINDYYGGSVGGTGPVVFFSSTGCILKNSTIQGHSGSFNNGRALFTDNYSAILIEQSDYTTIYNNTISRVWGIGTSSSDPNTYNHNNACIMLYNSSDTIMEHNDISDAGSGIFIKGIQGSVHLTQQRNIVRYNLIHDISEGVFEYFGEDSRIYNNVLMNIRKIGFHVGGGTNSVDLANNAVRTVFTNNTMYNVGDAGSGMCVGMQGPYVDTWTIKNNLCTDSLRAFGSLWDSTPAGYASQLFFDRNLYYNNTNDGYWSGGGTMTLATWQGTYSEDTNTSTSDPLFVNGSTTYTLATDFKLQGGSPALTLGRAVANICGATGATIPAGAYCTGSEAIGIESTTTPNRFSPLYLRR